MLVWEVARVEFDTDAPKWGPILFLKLPIRTSMFWGFSKILYITKKEESEVLVNVSQNRHFLARSSPNVLSDVISSISRHWPSLKSFWRAELKSVFYKGSRQEHVCCDFFQKCGLRCITFWLNGFSVMIKSLIARKNIDWTKYS